MKIDVHAAEHTPVYPANLRRRRCYLVISGHVKRLSDDGMALDPRSVDLSDKGVRQVRELSVMMQHVAFDRAVCSDYSCARQTANILLDEQESMLEQAKAFSDIKAGCFSKITPQHPDDRVCQAYETIGEGDGTFLGGEHWDSFENRVLEQFFRLIGEPAWRSLLLVSHDAVGRVLLAWAMGSDRHIMSSLKQDSACLNIIDLDVVGTQVLKRLVRAINITPYDLCKVADSQTVLTVS